MTINPDDYLDLPGFAEDVRAALRSGQKMYDSEGRFGEPSGPFLAQGNTSNDHIRIPPRLLQWMIDRGWLERTRDGWAWQLTEQGKQDILTSGRDI